MDDPTQDEPLPAPHVRATAPWSFRPPSPPPITVLPIVTSERSLADLDSSYRTIDSTFLSPADLAVIAADETVDDEEAADHPFDSLPPNNQDWKYEKRWQAQAVLRFLYLGPTAVARNKEWLHETGITKVVVMRHQTQAAHRMRTFDSICEELGITAEYFYGTTKWDIIDQFPILIRIINDHLIDFHRRLKGDGMTAVVDGGSPPRKTGRVLVVCESGNDWAPPVVAAYLMAMYGLSAVAAIKRVTLRRFSSTFNQETKRMLSSWEDIVQARRAVAQALQTESTQGNLDEALVARPNKRSIVDTMDVDVIENPNSFELDKDRYEGREAFMPFTDA